MKRMIKHFSFLMALAVVFSLLAVTAYAKETTTESDLDLSLVFASETQLTVYVDGEWSDTLSGSYGVGDTATIKAPADSGSKSFSHWEADGSIISYSRTLKLTMNAHTTLYAVYADTAQEAKPVAGFTSITRTNDGGSIFFQAIADEEASTDAGIVYSTTAVGDALKIGGTGVTNVPAEKITDSTGTMPQSVLDSNNCWMLEITPDSDSTVYHVRAYVTAGGTTTYGDVKDVKLAGLESGVSLKANLEGFKEGTNDKLASLTERMRIVTYDGNGGTGTMAPQVVLEGKEANLTANTFICDDYAFSGWSTEKDGSGTVYTDGQSVTLSENTTLYAQWKSTKTAMITAPAAKTGLIYNGQAQELVTGGEAEGGTMQYALGTEIEATGSYTTDIPKATDAGTYFVWYKAVGDENHTDSAADVVEVTIAKNTLSPFADDVTVTYDQDAHKITVRNVPESAKVKYGIEDGRYVFGTCPSYTDAGIYTVYYQITDPNYEDFTGSVILTIARRDITISGIKARDKTYDSTTAAELVYDDVVFDGILEGDTLTISAEGTFADAEAGNDKTVAITNLTLGGESAANYVLAESGQQTTATADIISQAGEIEQSEEPSDMPSQEPAEVPGTQPAAEPTATPATSTSAEPAAATPSKASTAASTTPSKTPTAASTAMPVTPVTAKTGDTATPIVWLWVLTFTGGLFLIVSKAGRRKGKKCTEK